MQYIYHFPTPSSFVHHSPFTESPYRLHNVDNTFCDVEIEKITIQDRLYTSGDHSNQVEEALRVIAIDPVENVQSTVATKGEEVVAGDSLSFTGLTDHEQLRKDCNRFQVDGKCPQNLKQTL